MNFGLLKDKKAKWLKKKHVSSYYLTTLDGLCKEIKFKFNWVLLLENMILYFFAIIMSFLHLRSRSPLKKLVDNLRASYDPLILYPFHKKPSLVPNLSSINSGHAVILFLNIYFNVVIHSSPRSSRFSLSFRFSYHGFEFIYGTLFTTCHVHLIDLN